MKTRLTSALALVAFATSLVGVSAHEAMPVVKKYAGTPKAASVMPKVAAKTAMAKKTSKKSIKSK